MAGRRRDRVGRSPSLAGLGVLLLTPGCGSDEPIARLAARTEPASLVFVGDVMFDRAVAGDFAARGLAPEAALDPTREHVSAVDFAAFNLETSVSDDRAPLDKRYTFDSDASLLTARRFAQLPRPERPELDLDRREGLGARPHVASMRCLHAVAVPIELQHLEQLARGIDPPDPGHPGVGVDCALLVAVEARRAGREHLADPVRRELEEGDVGELWHALTPPAGEIRDDHVGLEA